MENDIHEVLTRQPILLFDGECGFCNRTVQYFLRHEKKTGSRAGVMRFAPLQSDVGKQIRDYFGIGPDLDSLILIKDYTAHDKSCAALRLTLYMKGAWPLLMVFVIIPPFFRNLVYDFVAKRRMRIFGRVESCELLSKEDQSRFLDRQQAVAASR
jgi:predicted DCC family thiol-disulfide oxidoreductase YuxK